MSTLQLQSVPFCMGFGEALSLSVPPSLAEFRAVRLQGCLQTCGLMSQNRPMGQRKKNPAEAGVTGVGQWSMILESRRNRV